MAMASLPLPETTAQSSIGAICLSAVIFGHDYSPMLKYSIGYRISKAGWVPKSAIKIMHVTCI
jgi:hypothetical protein